MRNLLALLTIIGLSFNALPQELHNSRNVAAPLQDVVIPAYFYPGPLWSQAIANAPTVKIMIMNPASGPGTAVDRNYVAVVKKAVAAGITIMGYVHTTYGQRSTNAVKAEINQYFKWYNVKNIFLDEVSSDSALLPYYRNLADYIHRQKGIVMLNHGTVPVEQYVNVGDILVTFEGMYGSYLSAQFPQWVYNYQGKKFCHLVYNVPTSEQMTAVVNLGQQRNAVHMYVTDDIFTVYSDGTLGLNPWDSLPTYFTSEIDLLKLH